MVACLWQALPTKTNKEMADYYSISRSFYQPGQSVWLWDSILVRHSIKGLATDFSESYFIYCKSTTDCDISEVSIQENYFFYTVLGAKVLEKYFGEPHFISLQSLQSGLYLYTFRGRCYFQERKNTKILKFSRIITSLF
jgi:hypothetical protein